MDKKALGARISAMRKETGMTAAALAQRCGVKAVFIRQIERGFNTPSLPTFVKICNALRATPTELLAGSLSIERDDAFQGLAGKLRTLTPRQVDFLHVMVDTAIEKLG